MRRGERHLKRVVIHFQSSTDVGVSFHSARILLRILSRPASRFTVGKAIQVYCKIFQKKSLSSECTLRVYPWSTHNKEHAQERETGDSEIHHHHIRRCTKAMRYVCSEYVLYCSKPGIEVGRLFSNTYPLCSIQGVPEYQHSSRQ